MPTHAETMVQKYEALLEANPGVTSVTVDGVAVSYADLEAKLAYWQSKLDGQRGKRPGAASVSLGGF